MQSDFIKEYDITRFIDPWRNNTSDVSDPSYHFDVSNPSSISFNTSRILNIGEGCQQRLNDFFIKSGTGDEDIVKESPYLLQLFCSQRRTRSKSDFIPEVVSMFTMESKYMLD